MITNTAANPTVRPPALEPGLSEETRGRLVGVAATQDLHALQREAGQLCSALGFDTDEALDVVVGLDEISYYLLVAMSARHSVLLRGKPGGGPATLEIRIAGFGADPDGAEASAALPASSTAVAVALSSYRSLFDELRIFPDARGGCRVYASKKVRR